MWVSILKIVAGRKRNLREEVGAVVLVQAQEMSMTGPGWVAELWSFEVETWTCWATGAVWFWRRRRNPGFPLDFHVWLDLNQVPFLKTVHKAPW